MKKFVLTLVTLPKNNVKIFYFWFQVVQYKQNSRLEEKRKKALDLHLNFIVDQTEKYSTWLTESLQTKTSSCRTSSVISDSIEGRDGMVVYWLDNIYSSFNFSEKCVQFVIDSLITTSNEETLLLWFCRKTLWEMFLWYYKHTTHRLMVNVKNLFSW